MSNKNLIKIGGEGTVFEKTKRAFDENWTVFYKIEQSLFFYDFYIVLHFDEFCMTHCFEFLNYVLIKNLVMGSNFKKNILFFKKIKFKI
jgi:hypothetical protein